MEYFLLELLRYMFYVVSGLLVIISLAYIVPRVASIAHFRSKAEYDRSHRGPFNGETNAEE